MNRRIGLALGSGGWKGLAHLGVLRALEELEIRPALYAGASVGALVAAAAACRVRLGYLEQLAQDYRGKLFRVDLGNLIRYGVRTPALFSETPLRSLCSQLFGDMTFRDLPTPALVATLDVWTGETIWWGALDHQNVLVADAVYASCAMPGLLPAGRVGHALCMDGGVLDPLGLQALDGLVDEVVVVELGNTCGAVCDPLEKPSGSRLWWSAQTLVMRDLSRHLLRNWQGPPIQIVRPQLRGVEVLRVNDPRRVVRAGYQAALSALGDGDNEQAEVTDRYPIG